MRLEIQLKLSTLCGWACKMGWMSLWDFGVLPNRAKLKLFQLTGERIEANCPIKLVLESEVKSWGNFGGTSRAQRYKRELKEAKTNLIGEQWIRGLQNVKLHWTFTAISLKTKDKCRVENISFCSILSISSPSSDGLHLLRPMDPA